MSKSTASLAILLAALAAQPVLAEPRMLAGDQRGEQLIATGASDTLSAPSTVFHQMVHDARGLGPLGLATGAVRGSFRAFAQAFKGTARMAIGVTDTLTAPLGNR